MSSEGNDDRATEAESADASESFFQGVRDAHLRPDGGERTRRRKRSVAARVGNGADDAAVDERATVTTRRSRQQLDPACPTTPAIRAAATLDSVVHVGPATERPYGTERHVRHTAADGVSQRVAVRACRVPHGERDGFADALASQLHRWTTASDVDGVVPILERGGDERPWVVTAATGPTLCGRDTPSVSRGLDQAMRLTRVLADLHERGVVHAGIDPSTVVLGVGDAGPAAPALHNPGLADVYRRYEDPATVLDPRYAAPEYFESNRGIVDRATDIYGLGVVCFRLLTGVAPITGSASSIADRVTDDDPLPRPSRVDPRLPDGIDDVILTATATDKFDRFETAREFHEALSAVVEG